MWRASSSSSFSSSWRAPASGLLSFLHLSHYLLCFAPAIPSPSSPLGCDRSTMCLPRVAIAYSTTFTDRRTIVGVTHRSDSPVGVGDGQHNRPRDAGRFLLRNQYSNGLVARLTERSPRAQRASESLLVVHGGSHMKHSRTASSPAMQRFSLFWPFASLASGELGCASRAL